MGFLGTLAVAALFSAPPGADTLPAYADAATRAVVERARQRRLVQDSTLSDYAASLRYRLSFSVGKRRWARLPIAAVEEQTGRVRWRRPNDVQVAIEGRRSVARDAQLELSSVFDRPWFVARGADDSLRIVGRDFPAGGALHPLARDAEAWYHYAILDSVEVVRPAGPPLRLVRVEVTPRQGGRTLAAGRLWLDASSAEVVRFAFKYVGAVQWFAAEEPTRKDSSAVRRVNRLTNRFFGLELDLEYALQDGFWLPYRQTIAGRVRLPLGDGVVVPFEAVTRFADYEVNTGTPIAFRVPLPDSTKTDGQIRRARRDSLRAEFKRTGRRTWGGSERGWDAAGRWAGGRFEILRPSNDSLARYGAWTDTLTLAGPADDAERIRATAAELERLTARLPSDITDVPTHGFGYERSADILRFNRVQGQSVGLGYRVAAGTFANLYGTARYGFSDKRVTGRLSWVRDAPGGKLTISAYRDVLGVDPYAPGLGVANNLSASFAAHDYADYALFSGGAVTFETSIGTGLELVLRGSVERQDSVASVATARFNDWLGGSGVLGPNPGIDAGTFAGAAVGVRGSGPLRWGVTADLLAGRGEATGRLYGDARYDVGVNAGATLRVKGGIATANPFLQSAFRLGGPQTLRGLPYGDATGQAFWSAQLDVAPIPFFLRPVGFLDVGRAGLPGDLFSGQVRAAAGVGLSLYSRRFRTSVVRLDFSRPIQGGPDKWRFDLVIGGVR